MMRAPVRCGMAAALAVYLLATRAAADPAPSERLRMRDPSTLTLISGRVLELPPGRFIEEFEFMKWEIEIKRLQDAETRLTAERDSYKRSTESWSPGWKTLLGALTVGIAIGVFVAK
jgi:hypothetical protein